MKSFKLILLALSVGFCSFATNIEVWGRTYDYSCGYFSRRASDISVTLHHSNLPFGTKVNAIVGFRGNFPMGGWLKEVNWEDRTVIEAKATSENSFEARIIDKTLHGRSEGRFLSEMQFVFEIKAPGQATRYENGGSNWGYFQTEKLEKTVPCVSSGQLPNWKQLQFEAVKKD